MNKLFYFAPINTSFYAKEINKNLFVGAATLKVKAISSALTENGVLVNVVSSGAIKKNDQSGYRKNFVYFEDGVKYNFMCSILYGAYARLFAFFTYLWFSVVNIKKQDTVLLYNFYPEYILMAVVLKIRKINFHIDIEDAPEKNSRVLFEVINYYSYLALSKLASPKLVVASESVAAAIGAKIYLAIPGVVTSKITKKHILNNNEVINFLYCGSLYSNTGVDVFCDALKLIKNGFSDNEKKCLKIYVTGYGEIEKIKNLMSVSNDYLEFVELKSDLTREEFLKILEISHVGLSLKIPESNFGKGTFPSKVFELSSAGLLIVSYRIPDVVKIFENTGAVFIDNTDAASLFYAIKNILNNKNDISNVSFIGQKNISEKYSTIATGRKIKKYFFGDNL